MGENELITEEEVNMLLNSDEFDQDINSRNEKIDRIIDVKLELSVVIGRTKMKLKDILELNRGSLIELDTLASQDVEILIGDKVLAHGKVVVVDLNFGVKITKIMDQNNIVKNIF